MARILELLGPACLISVCMAGCVGTPPSGDDGDLPARLEGDPCDASRGCAIDLTCIDEVCRRPCNGDRECDQLSQHCEAGICLPGSVIACGNSTVDATEECDDGGIANDDGCSEFCRVENGWECDGTGCQLACGNGAVAVVGESCDDGNVAAGDGCDTQCNIESGWYCDDASPSSCTTQCGDGTVAGTEECDDGDTGVADACPSGAPDRCSNARCGDGYLWNSDGGSETCDDGNDAAGDGCSSTCAPETGWVCAGEPSVCSCAAGFVDDGGMCVSACLSAPWNTCGGFGTCADSPNGAVCTCDAGTQDNDSNGTCLPSCQGVLCNNGTCDDSSGTAECTCSLPWSGDNCDACRLYVDASSAAVAPQGTGWSDAFAQLEEALLLSDQLLTSNTSTCEVWVAAGVYPARRNNRGDSFELSERTALLGGFDGTETDRIQRNPVLNVTVLDGEDSVNHVVTGNNDATLDGFTVTGGDANNDGGGLRSANASGMLVRGCVFEANFASNDGGAVYSSDSDTTIEQCVFRNNSASNGGAVAHRLGTLTVGNSQFFGNMAVDNFGFGGGIYTDAAALFVATSVFVGNFADDPDGGSGGAVWVGDGFATIDSTLFVGNAAYGVGGFFSGGSGGAVNADNGGYDITRSALVGNYAEELGGAISALTNATSTVADSIVVGNWCERGGALFLADGADNQVVGSTLFGNVATIEGSGVYTTGVAAVTNTLAWGGIGDVLFRGVVNTGDIDVVHSLIENMSGHCPGCVQVAGVIEDDPLFVLPPAPASGIGTIVFNVTTYRSTVSVPGAGWAPGALAGLYAQVDDTDPRWWVITSNTADAFELWGDVSWASGDFVLVSVRLQSGSPAVDAGLHLLGGPDHEGNPRVQTTVTPPSGAAGAPSYPDIGALEVQP